MDFSNTNARARSDLHSPNDVCTSQAHQSPRVMQDWGGKNAASSPFRQNSVSRLTVADCLGVGKDIDGVGRSAAVKGGHRSICNLQATKTMPCDREAPIICPETKGADSEASSEAAAGGEELPCLRFHWTGGLLFLGTFE